MDLHPLEPLSSLEVMQAVSILKVFPSFTPTTRIICISLREPKKSLVFAWEASCKDWPQRSLDFFLASHAAQL
jgi:Cu2+-containing amine oxidase